MKIQKMRATFGTLENARLELGEGLNILEAPNESGKSTWCAFIRAMLYGIDSSERAKAGYLPDKLRYAPWSGAPMEGSMELTADNCNITITRGIPSVCMGMTWSPDKNNAGTLDHTLAEWFPIEGAYKGVQALVLMMLLKAGIA